MTVCSECSVIAMAAASQPMPSAGAPSLSPACVQVTEPEVGSWPHIPQECLPKAVALAGGAGVLERRMRNIGIEAQLLWHALDEECVAAAEGRHRQDAEQELFVIAPTKNAEH